MKLKELYEAPQNRVSHGMAAQDAVIAYLQRELGDRFELISKAGPSSDAPDIVGNVDGVRTQFEVKGRDSQTSPVKLYEKRVMRGEKVSVFNSFVNAYTNGKAKTLDQYIDGMRRIDDSIGYPDDEGVTAPAGKFYIATEDLKVRNTIRRHLVNHLHENNDDYFVVYTRSTGDIMIYDTGSANNQLQAIRLPNIRKLSLETYGSAGTEGKLRLAIKVQFAR